MLNVNQIQLDSWTVSLNHLRCGHHENVGSRLEKFNLIPLSNLKILSGENYGYKGL